MGSTPPSSVQKSSQKLEIQLQQTIPDIFLERTQIKVCSPHLLPIFSILHNVGRKQPQICPYAGLQHLIIPLTLVKRSWLTKSPFQAKDGIMSDLKLLATILYRIARTAKNKQRKHSPQTCGHHCYCPVRDYLSLR